MGKLVIAGREYTRADPSTMSFREAKEIKNKLGVSVVASVFAQQIDEDALLAITALSVMRADGSFSPEKLMDLSLSDIEFIEDEEDEAEETEDGEGRPLADSSEPAAAAKPKRQRKTAA